MKSILVGPKKQAEKRPDYPYLGIFPCGEVVLFVRRNEGFLIHSPVGWNPHFDTCWRESQAEPLKGEIILKN